MLRSVAARPLLTTFLLALTFLLLSWHRSTVDSHDRYGSPPETGHPTPIVGVGFDLSASYGTVALSFPNGSTVAVAKVDGNDQYREMMQRLSLTSSVHRAPPFMKPLEPLNDYPRRWWRDIRKKFRLPASHDVGILGQLMWELRLKAEEQLGYSVSTVVATTPHPIALNQEDIDDALDFVGLRYSFFVEYPSVGPMIEESIAAYVGYGRGVCANQYYTDWAACAADVQRHAWPSINLTTVVYTKSVLSWSLTVTGDIHGQYGSQRLSAEDFAFGADARTGYPGDYWAAVREHLAAPMLAYWRRPDVLLVVGESAHDEQFLGVLKDVVAEFTPSTPMYYENDTLFAAAKGAAELAKRAPFDPSYWRLAAAGGVGGRNVELR